MDREYWTTDGRRFVFSEHFYDNQRKKYCAPITEEMCIDVIDHCVYTEIQYDGRLRHWGQVDLFGDGRMRYLRVVTSATGYYIHTAFQYGKFRRRMRSRGTNIP